MSDLRKNLEKQRELQRQRQAYEAERDSLAASESSELRGSKSRSNLTKAVAKAVDAIGKIGAARSGGLVTGDLVPDMDFGRSELDAISEKYDTKRLELAEKARNLRDQIETVQDERALQKEADRLKKAAERTAKAEEKEAKRKEKATEREIVSVNSKARKAADRIMTEEEASKLSEDILNDEKDGEEVVELLEENKVPDELIEPFRQTVRGWMQNEDEELQANTIKELQQKLRVHFIRKHVKESMADGKTFDPAVLEALNLEDPAPQLTTPPESGKVNESAPETAPTGEPTRMRYEMILPNGDKKIILKTPEEALDIVEKADDKGIKIKLRKLK